MANAHVPQGSGGLGVPERLYRSNSDSKLGGKPDKELVKLGPPLSGARAQSDTRVGDPIPIPTPIPPAAAEPAQSTDEPLAVDPPRSPSPLDSSAAAATPPASADSAHGSPSVLRQRTKKKGPLDSASLMDVFEDKGKGKEKRRRGSSITSGTAKRVVLREIYNNLDSGEEEGGEDDASESAAAIPTRARQFMSSYKFRRALWGIILSVLERPELSGGDGFRFVFNYVIPVVELVVQYFQLSALNGYEFPDALLRPLEIVTDNVILLVHFPNDKWASCIGIACLMAAALLGLTYMGLLFAAGKKSSFVVSILAFYINVLVGLLYMPLLDELYEIVAEGWKAQGLLSPLSCAAGTMLCCFVPFCLFFSQNDYEDDERSLHILRQRHNRIALMVVVTKTTAVFVKISASPLVDSMVNVALFALMFLAYFFTNPYYVDRVNQVFNGAYLCLLYGAVMRLATPYLLDVDGAAGAALDYVHWSGVPLVFIVGYSFNLHTVELWRVQINSWLIRRLRFFDVADNPALIHELGLAELLHSATRQGIYARYLSRVTTDHKLIQWYFKRAIDSDPYHVDNLGNYAMYLWDCNRLDEADEMFRRAVMTDPCHRENLENYAYFLSQARNNQHEALYYYQMSIREYPEHYYYIDMYSNSADSMCILDPNAVVVDCNGATLRMLQCRTRNELIGRCLFDFLATEEERHKFHAGFQNVVSGDRSSVRFESMASTCQGKFVAVETVLTRIRRAAMGKDAFSIHLSWVDITELKELIETNEKIFEHANSPMFTVNQAGVVTAANASAELTFGFGKAEIVGQHVTTILTSYDALKGQLREKEVGMEVLVSRRDGKSLVCIARLAEITVAGRYMGVIILHDISELRRLLETVTLIFEKATTPMIMIDDEGIVQRWNECATETLEYTTEEMIGANVKMIMPDDVAEKHDGYLHRYKATGVKTVIGIKREVLAKTKSGKLLVCDLKLNELHVEGSGRFFIGMLHDLSDIKRLLETVEQIFEKGSSPIVMINEQGIIQKYNECAVETFGYSKEEAIGQNIKMLMPQDVADKHDGYLRRYVETGVKHVIGANREVLARAKDGTLKVCQLKLNEIKIGAGNMDRFFVGILHDITEAKRMLETVEQIFERGSTPMVMIDEQGIIEKYNECAAQTFGYSKKEAVGQNIKMLMPQDVADKHDGYLRRYVETGVKHVMGSKREVIARTKDGHHRICELKLNEVVTADRRHFVGILNDITDAKRIHETVEQIFEHGSSPIILVCMVIESKHQHLDMINEQGIIQKYNQCAVSTFGYSKEEAIGQNIKMLMPPDVADKHDGYLRRYVETGVKHVMDSARQVIAMAKDGSYRICELKLNEIKVGTDSVERYFVGILHDITESKRIHETVEQIFERGGTPMVMINEQGIIQKYNESAAQTFGYSKEEAIGQNIKMLMSPDVADKHDGYLRRYVETGVKHIVGRKRDVTAMTKDGRALICELKVNEIRVDDTGRYFVGILNDVTEARAMLETVEQVFEKADSPMIMINETGIIQRYNESAAATFGFSKEEALGSNINMLMPPEIAERHDGYLQRYKETGEKRVMGQRRQVPVITKDKRRLTCELKLSQIEVAGEKSYIGLMHDVSEFRRQQLFSKVQLALKSRVASKGSVTEESKASGDAEVDKEEETSCNNSVNHEEAD